MFQGIPKGGWVTGTIFWSFQQIHIKLVPKAKHCYRVRGYNNKQPPPPKKKKSLHGPTWELHSRGEEGAAEIRQTITIKSMYHRSDVDKHYVEK